MPSSFLPVEECWVSCGRCLLPLRGETGEQIRRGLQMLECASPTGLCPKPSLPLPAIDDWHCEADAAHLARIAEQARTRLVEVFGTLHLQSLDIGMYTIMFLMFLMLIPIAVVWLSLIWQLAATVPKNARISYLREGVKYCRSVFSHSFRDGLFAGVVEPLRTEMVRQYEHQRLTNFLRVSRFCGYVLPLLAVSMMPKSDFMFKACRSEGLEDDSFACIYSRFARQRDITSQAFGVLLILMCFVYAARWPERCGKRTIAATQACLYLGIMWHLWEMRHWQDYAIIQCRFLVHARLAFALLCGNPRALVIFNACLFLSQTYMIIVYNVDSIAIEMSIREALLNSLLVVFVGAQFDLLQIAQIQQLVVSRSCERDVTTASEILNTMCDAVVELDHFHIKVPCHKLSALLLRRCEKGLQGRKFVDFVAEPDQRRCVEALQEQRPAFSVHLHLRDSANVAVPVQVFIASLMNVSGGPGHVMGIVEETGLHRRPLEARHTSEDSGSDHIAPLRSRAERGLQPGDNGDDDLLPDMSGAIQSVVDCLPQPSRIGMPDCGTQSSDYSDEASTVVDYSEHCLTENAPEGWSGSPTLVWIDTNSANYKILGETMASLQKFGDTTEGDGLQDWSWKDDGLRKLKHMVDCFENDGHAYGAECRFTPAARAVEVTSYITPRAWCSVSETDKLLMLEFAKVETKRCRSKTQRAMLFSKAARAAAKVAQQNAIDCLPTRLGMPESRGTGSSEAGSESASEESLDQSEAATSSTDVENHFLCVDPLPDGWAGSPILIWININEANNMIVSETKDALQKFGNTKLGDGLKNWEWTGNSLTQLRLMISCFVAGIPLDHSHKKWPALKFIPAARNWISVKCSIRPVCFTNVDQEDARVLMLEFSSVEVQRLKQKPQRARLAATAASSAPSNVTSRKTRL